MSSSSSNDKQCRSECFERAVDSRYLCKAIEDGNVAAVLEELGKGKHDLNSSEYQNDEGQSLLHWSVALRGMEMEFRIYDRLQQRHDILTALIDHGACAWKVCRKMGLGGYMNVRAWDMTGQVLAKKMIMKACIEQFKKYAERDDDVNTSKETAGINESALCAAAYLNDIDTLRLAVKDGVDKDDDVCAYTPLSIAACQGNIEAVRVLVKELSVTVDHDIKQHGKTALTLAMLEGQTETVRYLIDEGADVFFEHFLERPTLDRPTIFCCASADVVQQVLDAMVAKIPNICKDESTHRQDFAFRVFVGQGHIEGVHRLLESGAEFPGNVLQYAVAFAQKDMLELLIAEGALKNYNPNARSVMAPFSQHRQFRNTYSEEMECQGILDQSIAAKEEFERFASEE